MKKRRLAALVLAGIMTIGAGMTAMADDETVAETSKGATETVEATDHSTEDNTHNGVVIGADGTISNKESNASTEKEATGQTDFIIKVDKDATSLGGKTVVAENDLGDYAITYELTATGNLSVTVPLYVCMYAYGGDGKVIVPDADGYKMTNNSIRHVKTEIKSIYPYYAVTVLDSEIDKSVKLVLDKNNQTYNLTGGYGYYDAGTKDYKAVLITDCITRGTNNNELWYKDTSAKNVTIDFTSTVVTSSDESSKEYVKETLKKGSEYPLELIDGYKDLPNDIVRTKNSSGEYTLGEYYVGQPLYVASIKVKEIGDWNIVNGKNALKAKELAMSINGLDLSEVKDKVYDIKYLGWTIAKSSVQLNDSTPEIVNNDEVKPQSTSLPIQASIAGDSVNGDAHVGVLQVSYTLSSLIEDEKITGTSGN